MTTDKLDLYECSCTDTSDCERCQRLRRKGFEFGENNGDVGVGLLVEENASLRAACEEKDRQLEQKERERTNWEIDARLRACNENDKDERIAALERERDGLRTSYLELRKIAERVHLSDGLTQNTPSCPLCDALRSSETPHE